MSDKANDATAQDRVWDEIGLPNEGSDDFTKLFYRERSDGDTKAPIFEPKAEHCGVWEDAINKDCYASFGDRGTTASASCFGNLIQVSQYLEAGHSGVFTMDSENTDEPFLFGWRSRTLDALSNDQDYIGECLGLYFPVEHYPEKPPGVRWVNWRWPRYKWTSQSNPRMNLISQFLVHDNVVLHQLLLKNTSSNESISGLDFWLNSRWLVRDMDHIDPSYGFNEANWNNHEPNGYRRMCTPHGRGIVIIHQLDSLKSEEQGSVDERMSNSSFQQESTEGSPSSQAKHHDSKRQAVASVMAVYVNGNAHDFGNELGPSTMIRHDIPPNKTLEIVTAHKLIMLPRQNEQDQRNERDNRNGQDNQHRQHGQEGQDHYDVNWRNFMISATEANVSEVLRKESQQLWGDDPSAAHYDLGLSMIAPGFVPSTDQPENVKVQLDPAAESVSKDKAPRATADLPHSGSSHQTSEKKNELLLPTVKYLVWRHLEHILSVCAVPLSPPPLFQAEDALLPKRREVKAKDEEQVALSCGDMSGHRVCTSASFFAFQFLLEVLHRLRHLKDEDSSSFTKDLQERINSTVRGHFKWLGLVRGEVDSSPKPSRLLASGCFAANYWVTGNIVPTPAHPDVWRQPNMMTDTPFQLLKLTGYMQSLRERTSEPTPSENSQDESRRIQDEHQTRTLIEETWDSLLRELDKLDKRKAYAWPHRREDGVNIFRLDDHFWLWRSLHEVKALGLWKDKVKVSENSEEQGAFEEPAKWLLPEKIQRAVIQRFSTDNDVLRTRMLAVTRSSRETRFLFHSRDTALFYGHRLGFFAQDKVLWDGTVRSQARHDGLDLEENPRKTLRYALGILAGLVGAEPWSTTSSTKDSKEWTIHCLGELIESTAQSGLSPGYIGENRFDRWLRQRKSDNRNYDYHVGLEVNYFILTQARYILELYPTNTSDSGKAMTPISHFTYMHPPPAALQGKAATKVDVGVSRGHAELDVHGLKTLDSTLGNSGASRKVPALALKKAMPFSTTVDDGSIVHLDNEWLYDYPEFLLTPHLPDDATKQSRSLIKQLNVSEHTGLPTAGPGIHPEPDIIEQQLQPYVCEPERQFKFASTMYQTITFVAQVPKQPHRKPQSKGNEKPSAKQHTNRQLWKYKLSCARSARSAKKRFIWLPCANSETALLCWMASVEGERIPMALFFDRHWKYKNHLWDDTTRQSNNWQTELHLSFYTLIEHADSSTPVNGTEFPTPITFSFSSRSKKMIAHAAMGFRFDGDFFDRYWTCHFIQHIPNAEPLESNSIKWDFDFHEDGRGRYSEKHWWQRKVLEIHLVNRMLAEITSGFTKVIQEVRKELNLGKEDLPSLSLAFLNMVNGDTRHLSMQLWPEIQFILRALDDELTSTLGTLNKWKTREGDRGKEQPRWTPNDERKYRGYINKFQAQTERKIWDLEISRNNTHALLETITSKQEQIRNEQERKRNEIEARHEGNIRLFTYVTVIFLPLGFATSLYSMSGPPQYLWLISLVESSAAAFAVTIFLVVCTRLLLPHKDNMPAILKALPGVIINKSGTAVKSGWRRLLAFNLHIDSLHDARREGWLSRSEQDAPDTADKPRGESHPKPTGWMRFIFLEIPARRVSIAISQLKDGTPSAGAAVLHIILGALSSILYVVARAFQVLLSMSYGYVRNIVRIVAWALLLCYLPRSETDLPPREDSESRLPDPLEQDSLARFKRMTTWKPPAGLAALQDIEQKLHQRVQVAEGKKRESKNGATSADAGGSNEARENDTTEGPQTSAEDGMV